MWHQLSFVCACRGVIYANAFVFCAQTYPHSSSSIAVIVTAIIMTGDSNSKKLSAQHKFVSPLPSFLGLSDTHVLLAVLIILIILLNPLAPLAGVFKG